jgi:small-conductance mechanosensitive channel
MNCLLVRQIVVLIVGLGFLPYAAPLLAQGTPAAAPIAELVPASPPVKLFDLATVEQILGKDVAKVAEMVRGIWNIVLISGPDDKKPVVTVGTLAGGIVLLGLGYIAAGMFSRWFAGKLLTRFRLNKSGVAPLQSLMFYLLFASFAMVSLNVLHVPITAFSFFGGALAIGAGFGSQNVVNNFISGLILLVERPIRVGDVIELESMIGTVMQIGARSTNIATSANREIIVPNSKLLETSVINWTLSDDLGGCVVKVGAAYGSPVREVERLLLEAASGHPKVLKAPASEVVFADFGADSLMFELRFHVNLRETRKSEVESELRFTIDELFADRGIVMAYPQRDVHLNVLRPVEIRLSQPLSQSVNQAKAA